MNEIRPDQEIEGAGAPGSHAPGSGLPAPAPSFLMLIFLHLKLTVKEAQAGSAVLLLVSVALPIAVLFSPVPEDMFDPFSGGARLVMLTTTVMAITVLMAFLWPEAVWRNLAPGSRGVLDALPASRRLHRMARVVAGAAFPALVTGSLFLTMAIMRARGWMEELFPGLMPGFEGLGVVAASLSLLCAYTMSSALAIRFGRVFFSLLVIVLLFYIIPMILFLAGFEDLIRVMGEWVATNTYSPVRVVTMGYGATPSDIAPALAWLAVFGGITTFLAGRHDQA